MRAAIGALAGVCLLLAAGCSGTGAQQYAPLFAPVKTATAASPGTLRGDYDAAARARDLREAASLWEQFLKRHKPVDGEYEDAFQKRLIDSATYELIRVCYLSGERNKGDQLLRELDPLQLR